MKKFLAVTLSAAMVLSVSVPAMADDAGTNTQTEAVATSQKSVEEAKAKEAAAKENFDKAYAALQESLQKLDELQKIKGKVDPPTKKEIEDHKSALLEARNAKAIQEGVVADREEAVADAELAKEEAEADYQSAVAGYNYVKPLATADPDKYGAKLTEAEDKVKSTREAYDGVTIDASKKIKTVDDLIKAPEGKGGAVAAVADAKEMLAEEEAKLKQDFDGRIREALKEVGRDLAKTAAAKDGKNAVANAEKEVKANQKAVDEALTAWNAAKEETRAAVAKQDEGRKRIAAEMYEKAKLEVKMAEEDEAKALDLLNKAKAELDKIRAEIDKNLGYITAYDQAVKDEATAQDVATEAAVTFADKQAMVAVLEAVVKENNGLVESVDDAIARIQRQLDEAKANPEYKVSPSLSAFLAAEGRVAELEAQLEEAKEEWPNNAKTVAENGKAMLAKATDEMNAAQEAWNSSELKAQAAVDALKTAEANFKKALKKLYVLDPDTGMPVDEKVEEPLSRVDGQWIFLDDNDKPLKDEKDSVIVGTPLKLVDYEQIEYAVAWEETDEAAGYIPLIDDNGEQVYVELEDGKYVPAYELEKIKVPTHFTSMNGDPKSLYAKEEVAIAAVKIAQKVYDATVVAHNEALKKLAEAEAEYVYYNGKKPDDPTPTPTPEKPIPTNFTDVKANDWFAPYVGDVVEKGIMKGKNATLFGSYAPLERQDFAVILWRMAGEPKVVGAPTFVDVADDYYAPAVQWAASAGIVKGYADTGYTVFGVGDNITREDFAVMLHRFFNYPSSSQSLDSFADASSISLYAKDAVKWAVEFGAITGKDNGTRIAPQDKIARAEAAKILSVITDSIDQ